MYVYAHTLIYKHISHHMCVYVFTFYITRINVHAKTHLLLHLASPLWLLWLSFTASRFIICKVPGLASMCWVAYVLSGLSCAWTQLSIKFAFLNTTGNQGTKASRPLSRLVTQVTTYPSNTTGQPIVPNLANSSEDNLICQTDWVIGCLVSA